MEHVCTAYSSNFYGTEGTVIIFFWEYVRINTWYFWHLSRLYAKTICQLSFGRGQKKHVYYPNHASGTPHHIPQFFFQSSKPKKGGSNLKPLDHPIGHNSGCGWNKATVFRSISSPLALNFCWWSGYIVLTYNRDKSWKYHVLIPTWAQTFYQ